MEATVVDLNCPRHTISVRIPGRMLKSIADRLACVSPTKFDGSENRHCGACKTLASLLRGLGNELMWRFNPVQYAWIETVVFPDGTALVGDANDNEPGRYLVFELDYESQSICLEIRRDLLVPIANLLYQDKPYRRFQPCVNMAALLRNMSGVLYGDISAQKFVDQVYLVTLPDGTEYVDGEIYEEEEEEVAA